MKKGIFISIEGPDGSGKSTQVNNIKKYFDEKEIELIYTREPGGTKISEKIRDVILDIANAEITDMTETLLYAASRAQHVEEIIRPNIEKGNIVLYDRYVDSSIAYQGYGRSLGAAVATINKYATNNLMPDITIFLALDPEIGRSRINAEDKDRLESASSDFHKKVYDGYMQMAKNEPERYRVIDASQDIESVKNDIIKVLNSLNI